MVIPRWCLETTYRSHPQGSRGPETSESNYHYSLRNNSKQRSSQLLRGWGLKSRNQKPGHRFFRKKVARPGPEWEGRAGGWGVMGIIGNMVLEYSAFTKAKQFLWRLSAIWARAAKNVRSSVLGRKNFKEYWVRRDAELLPGALDWPATSLASSRTNVGTSKRKWQMENKEQHLIIHTYKSYSS